MRQLLDGEFPTPENKITDFKYKHTEYDSIFVRIQCHYDDY